MVYVLVDTNRTQEYVFASRRLFGIRNASRLLATVDRQVGRHAAHKGQCIRAAGGVVIAKFDGADEDTDASAFVKWAREAYRRIGVGVETATHKCQPTHGSFYDDVVLPLLTKVRVEKDSPSRADAGSPSSILCVPCESSGLGPAERVISLGDTIPRVTAAEAMKWRARDRDDEPSHAISTAVQHLLGSESQRLPCASTLEEVVSWKVGPAAGDVPEGSEARQVGFVFADVNGLGGVLKLVAHTEKSFADFSESLRTVLIETMAVAAARTLGPALDRRMGQRGLAVPLTPVYVGGDDLCVAVAAPFAMGFVECLLKLFEQNSQPLLAQTEASARPPSLTMSAGVVIAPFNYPILSTSRLGRELEGRAKRAGRYFAELLRTPVLPSLVDFHVVKNSMLGGLDNARKASVSVLDGQQVEWFGGPYLGGEDPDAVDSARTFVRLSLVREAARRIGGADGPLPRSKVADLRALIAAGIQPPAYTDWVAHLSEPALNQWRDVCQLLELADPSLGVPMRSRLPRSSAVLDAMELARLESVRKRWEA